MKLSLLFIFLLCSFFATAQIVDIPDANFKNALLNHVPVIDTNNDGEIQVSEAEAVDGELDLFNFKIEDLTGIEAFINLTVLNCSGNNLTEIDISSNLDLIELDMSFNNISSLDVGANLALTELNCDTNNLNSIDVSLNVNLIALNLSRNIFSSIDLSSNLSLENLSCGLCNLTTLDVTQNTNLNQLAISSNQIETIDVTQNTNLNQLAISGNQIETIDLSQNVNLTRFIGSENQIETIDLSQNINLEVLQLTGNLFASLDVSQLSNLNNLFANRNLLTSLDLSQNPELETLEVRDNFLSSLDTSNNINLRLFSCRSNPIVSLDVSENSDLFLLYANNTSISEIDLSNNPNITDLQIKSNFYLEYINLQNGTNTDVSSFTAINNPNLAFICVDDVAFASENFTDVSPLTTFVEDCSIANNDLNTIEGILTYDDEGNGCDTNDLGISGLFVNTTDGTNNFATSSINDGLYRLTVTENSYTTSVLGLPSYFTLSPAEAVDTFAGFNQTETADFCITPNTTANDLAVTLVPLVDARPGFDTSYQLVYENLGTTTLSGSVVLNFDNGRVAFLEAMPTASSQTASSLTWNFTGLGVFEKAIINVDFNVLPPPTNESGDTLAFTATANPVTGDATPDDNEFTLNQIVVNSLDPNDKKVLEGSQRLIAEASQALHYVVRFQNLGTASAINVRVQDVLDAQLDWTTLRVLDASHAMETTLVNGQIDFIFDDINLPNEATDPEGSNGYVSYSIKPLPGIAVGDMIENTADIYFDFNAAITTNTVSTQYVTELSIPDVVANDIVLYPNPTSDFITIKAATEILSISVFNVLGQKVIVPVTLSNEASTDLSSLQNGVYFVSVLVPEGSEVFQVIKE